MNRIAFPWRIASLLAVVTSTVALSVSQVQSQNRATISIDGSSTVYPVTEAVAEEFQKMKKGAVRVTVGVSGTGGGFKKFCNGETHISNASRPIKKSEQDACKAKGINYIELPVAYDALTVVVNPQNKAVSDLTTAELKKMWQASSQGNVSSWNQIRASWPKDKFKLYGPGADSGTFDYFKEEILGDAGIRKDFTPSEDDNVLVQGVSRDKNALGYFGFAYYDENKSRLKAVKINGVMPSAQTVNNGKYKPLSRPIYIYVSSKVAAKPEIKEFVNYYLTNAAKFSKEVAYIPLPAADYTKAKQRFANGQMGRIPLRAGL
ncbi:phosphate binding protein [Rippkaea orientalis PCC 8801]|uniref:Phosphate-binding protein n=1 Tax=Rippkaea orientalis (strain PCC 8801 / RF-1) TaxID=41431 RepID=B7K0V8_RIPO1|nr:PstS family phosphate ABC transporter substrate-binding protein [Rippkaea orientalis]ACK65099.1 phosphate binding protein [Rippkaea orientalis PCC 8801]